MRPLLVPSSYPPNLGGVEEVTSRLATGLLRYGHAPLVLTNQWPKELVQEEVVDGVPVARRRLRVPNRSVRGVGGYLLNARATHRDVIAVARAHKCDVVNVHCVSSNMEYAMSVADRLGLPLVVSLHGELSGDADRLYERSPRMRRTWETAMDRAVHVTAPSHFTLEEATAFRGRALPSATVIRNGVDHTLFAGRQTPARPIVFAAGRLVTAKGYDVLLHAWERVGVRHPEVDLVIAGDGPEHVELIRLAAGLPNAERVRLTGKLSREALAELMRSATAFVQPSHHEALGLAVMEAMAASTPVVASAVGGIPELINGSTGLLVPAGDVVALADALSDVLDDPISANGRALLARDVVAPLTWAACTDAYLDVYRDAAAPRGRR